MENSEIEKEILQEKKSISRLRVFLIVLLVGVVGGFAASYYGESKFAGRTMVDASVFDVRLQNVENAIPVYDKRIAKLEETLAASGSKPATPAATAVSPELNDRLETLEKAVSAPKPRATAQNSEQVFASITLLSSYHRLSGKVLSGKPFAPELADFQKKFGTDSEAPLNDTFSALTPYADSGIPTISGLLSMFDDAAASMRNRDSQPPADASWWEKFCFNISRMVSIRKIDKNQTGNTPDAIIGRAEDDLSGDDLDTAIREIKSLPDAQRNNFAAWLEDARIANLAPSYIDQIEEQVMKKSFSAAKKTD